jgi:hypothetical protein
MSRDLQEGPTAEEALEQLKEADRLANLIDATSKVHPSDEDLLIIDRNEWENLIAQLGD